MQDVILSYHNLAPVLLLDRYYESKPDPFRLQGNRVVFTIPFVEYKNFIKFCLRAVDYLATPTKTLRSLEVRNKDNLLYSCYMKDIACAIAKELFYAEKAKKAASYYRHCSDGVHVYNVEEVEKLYSTITTEREFRDYLDSKGYTIPKNVSDINSILWKYANVLYSMSRTVVDEWEISFK